MMRFFVIVLFGLVIVLLGYYGYVWLGGVIVSVSKVFVFGMFIKLLIIILFVLFFMYSYVIFLYIILRVGENYFSFY